MLKPSAEAGDERNPTPAIGVRIALATCTPSRHVSAIRYRRLELACHHKKNKYYKPQCRTTFLESLISPVKPPIQDGGGTHSRRALRL